jgi:hypothetical protein
MKFQTAIPVTAALFVLFIAPSSARAAAPTACDLLSAQTAALLAGGPVGKPIDKNGKSCMYPITGKITSVQVIMTDAPGTSGADAIASYQKMPASTAKTETIPGLGDQNLLVVMNRGPRENILMVLYHQKMVALSVEGPNTPELKAAMIQAVKQMIAQI